MERFTDANGKEWMLRFDVQTLRRVNKQTGFELGTSLQNNGESLFGMLEDLELFPQVLYWAVGNTSVDQASFESAIHGDVFDGAREAFCKAFSFFCPRSWRMQIQNALEFEKLSVEHQTRVKQAIETITANAFISEPESESSPDRTPTENSSACSKPSRKSDGITLPELSKY